MCTIWCVFTVYFWCVDHLIDIWLKNILRLYDWIGQNFNDLREFNTILVFYKGFEKQNAEFPQRKKKIKNKIF